jgi:hypothetical protein
MHKLHIFRGLYIIAYDKKMSSLYVVSPRKMCILCILFFKNYNYFNIYV